MIYTLTTWIIPLLLCVIVHEVAHGIVALKLGDRTALNAGRLTLNPLPHFDSVGSFMIPGLLWLLHSPIMFGWAKPVPVNFGNLNHPKRDMGLVAVAGPLSNLILAIVFVLILKVCVFILPEGPMLLWLAKNLANGIMMSLVLGIFNLLPILPLDGGRILVSVLPLKWATLYQTTEKYGFFILFGVISFSYISGWNVIGWFIGTLYPVFVKIVSLFL